MKQSIENLIKALENAIDSLEYVNRAHPEATGYGVREERIRKGLEAITAYRALEPSSCGLYGSSDSEYHADGPPWNPETSGWPGPR